jgi:2-iminoacetate synthase ThiH
VSASLLDFYTNAPLLELGLEADRARTARHPDGIVTYIVDRNINYTNVCVADCGFCAFYRRPKHGEGYTLSFEQIGAKIEETKALGGVQILIQGGHNPYIPFEWYLDLMRYIKRHHPIHIHGFSPSEVDFFSTVFRMDAVDVIRELRKAGLDSIPGGGGEILVQRVRDIVAPKKAGADRWLEIMELAHNEGMKTSVTMMYGRANRAPRTRPSLAVPHRRVHGVHHLAAAAREHADDVAHAKNGRHGVPPHRGHRAHRARQRPEPPVVLGHDGPEDRPARPALRLQ